MAKRLTFDVPEELHAKLKSEAAALGVPLGTHCARVLNGGSPAGLPTADELDTTTLAAMPLGILRQLCQDLADNKPNGWSQTIVRIQTEIRRRYRV